MNKFGGAALLAGALTACSPDHRRCDHTYENSQTHTVTNSTDPSLEIGGEACMFDESGSYEDSKKLCLNLEYAEIQIVAADSGFVLADGTTDGNGRINIDISQPGFNYLNSTSAIRIIVKDGALRVNKDELPRETIPDTFNELKLRRKGIIDKGFSTYITFQTLHEALGGNNVVNIRKPQIAYGEIVRQIIENPDAGNSFFEIQAQAAAEMGIFDINRNGTLVDDVNLTTNNNGYSTATNNVVNNIVSYGNSFVHIDRD